ncbi:MAG: hypothetical protein ACXW2E_12830 [Nitrososphaeraceae archaeon]
MTNKKQISLLPFPKEIKKLVSVLENTDLKFYKGYMKNYADERYCLVGAISHLAGVNDDLIVEQCLISDTNHSIGISLQIYDLIGIDLLKNYEKTIEYCPLCDEAHDFSDPESVLNHLNDDHNKKETHKENARLITEFSKHYDIITGKEVQSKLI